MKTLDIFVRHGKRGYVGYYGERGNLKSTHQVRSRYGQAKSDALHALVNTRDRDSEN